MSTEQKEKIKNLIFRLRLENQKSEETIFKKQQQIGENNTYLQALVNIIGSEFDDEPSQNSDNTLFSR